VNLQLAPRTLALALAAVIAVLGVGGWFGLVASQRSTASSLADQTADAQVSLDALKTPTQTKGHSAAAETKATAGPGKRKVDTRASQIAQLRAAFPDQVQMPSMLLEVHRLATRSGVSLDSFSPSMPTPGSGYDSIQISVAVTGRYAGIQRFVHALRAQAASVHGHVHASGRLFSVDTVGIVPAADGLPKLTATLVVDAYVYTGVVPATESDNSTDTGDGSSTTPATTTTSSGGTSP
jgi:Tfp pilus assembly protein PilO